MMKRISTLLLFLTLALSLFAQERMYIHKTDNITLGVSIADVNDITFSDDNTISYFNIEGVVYQYGVSDIDSITFGDNSNTIDVIYSGTSVKVVNPLAFEGVSVVVEGARVTVTSTSADATINYRLSGSSTDGLFKIYCDAAFNLLLNGVDLCNTTGAPVNIQSEQNVSVTLVTNSVNKLSDGTTYTAMYNRSSEVEDQKAALFSEGNLTFSGDGSLTITGIGSSKHGLCSDGVVEIDGGAITIASALKDGLHAGDGFVMKGGSLTVTASGDAIDADAGGVAVSGGSINTTTATNATKAIKSDLDMLFSGGTIVLNTSGSVSLEASGLGYDPSYCSGIKCGGSITISDGSMTIVSTGIAGKGISADVDVNISGGTVNISTSGAGAKYLDATGVADAYSSSCIGADGNISLTGGNITVSSTGAAGKGISADGTLIIGTTTAGPVLIAKTSGAQVYVSGTGDSADYANPKAIKSTGALTINSGSITVTTTKAGGEGIESKALMTINGGMMELTTYDDAINASTEGTNGSAQLIINGGTIYCYATNNDGIDSNGTITINGGLIISSGTTAPEEGIDCDQNTFLINGGTLVGFGGATSTPSTGSTDYSLVYTGSGTANTGMQISSSSGDVLVVKVPRAYSSMVLLFSSSSLVKSTTYTVKSGVTITGGTEFHGYYTGATCSGGTSKGTFTPNTSKVISVKGN